MILALDYSKFSKIFRISNFGLKPKTQLTHPLVHNQYNVAHRDIKPDNLLVNKQGIIHITDFGVSQQFKDKDDTTDVKFGTPAYHPPEVYTQ